MTPGPFTAIALTAPSATDRRIRATLLGTPSVTDLDGRVLAGLGAGKPLAMLAYLAVRGPARRDELVALLWGEIDEARARNAFRQSLHRLRSALGEDLLVQDAKTVAVPDDVRLQTDVTEFTAAIDAERFADAVRLYRGEFLDAFDVGELAFSQWADVERARLNSLYQRALGEATREFLTAGKLSEAIAAAVRLAEVAPFDADAAVLEATTLVSAGRATDALRSLRRYATRLDSELGLAVPAKVQSLIDRVAAGDVAVAGSSSGRSGRSRLTPRSTTLVGRDAQLAQLGAALSRTSDGNGATIVVSGEAGIGKTTLVREALRRTSAVHSMLVMWGVERAGSSIPYASLVEALRDIADAPGVAGTSQHLLAEAARMLPQLRDRFALPAAGPLGDDSARLRFFEGIAALLDAVAYEQPIALVVDDAHNAAAATSELIAYLASRLASSAMALIIVVRAEAGTTTLLKRLGFDADGGPGPHVDIIPVPPLTQSETTSLLESIPDAGRVSAEELYRIAGLSGGNPLRALEYLRRAAQGESISAAPVPLRDLMWGRVRSCSPIERRLLIAAGILERPISLRVLAAAAHLGESAAYDAALTLRQKHLLADFDDGRLGVLEGFSPEFILDLCGAAGRSLLTGWAADALAAESLGDDAQLAGLYALAGRAKEAFHHSRLAAHRAMAFGATPDALRFLNLARTFAPDPRAAAEIESLFSALGEGRYALPAPAQPDEALEVQVAASGTDSAEEQPGPPAQSPAQPEGRSAAPSIVRTHRKLGRHFGTLVAILVVSIGLAAGIRMRGRGAAGARADLSDTLVLAGRGPSRATRYWVTGAFAVSGPRAKDASSPAWVDSLSLPWVDPHVAPGGASVALERMTRSGTDVYLASADGRRRVPIALGGGDNAVLDWAPDGSALLVARARTLPDGSAHADLIALHADGAAARVIDSTSSHSVVEAEWSPDGTHLAWVSRTGPTHQQDVFVSAADGSRARNVSADPSEDYHIQWSPDGTVLAFTSERTGHAELFAVRLPDYRRWQLTHDSTQVDHASFSPDGRWLAYESTRGGDDAIYVMPTLGGAATRVSPQGEAVAIERWRGAMPSFLDRVSASAPPVAKPGDTLEVTAHGVSREGHPIAFVDAEWLALDSGIASLTPPTASAPESRRLVAHTAGLARIEVSAARWRTDTLLVAVGASELVLMNDAFDSGLLEDHWRALGDPLPTIGAEAGRGATRGLVPNADLQWESGILSRQVVPLRAGLSVDCWVSAPMADTTASNRSLVIALVAVDPPSAIAAAAPQFFRLASVSWSGDAGRLTYSTAGESYSEPAARVGGARSHQVRIAIDADGHAEFFVDDRLRYRSRVRATGQSGSDQAQVWLAGRGTGKTVIFDDVRVSLQPVGAKTTSGPQRVSSR